MPFLIASDFSRLSDAALEALRKEGQKELSQLERDWRDTEADLYLVKMEQRRRSLAAAE